MISILPQSHNHILGFEISQKLQHKDYQNTLIPHIDNLLKKYNKLSILCHIKNLQGIELQAAWDDLCFGIQHYNHFIKLALVSDQNLSELTSTLIQPFTTAHIKIFQSNQIKQAWA